MSLEIYRDPGNTNRLVHTVFPGGLYIIRHTMIDGPHCLGIHCSEMPSVGGSIRDFLLTPTLDQKPEQWEAMTREAFNLAPDMDIVKPDQPAEFRIVSELGQYVTYAVMHTSRVDNAVDLQSHLKPEPPPSWAAA